MLRIRNIFLSVSSYFGTVLIECLDQVNTKCCRRQCSINRKVCTRFRRFSPHLTSPHLTVRFQIRTAPNRTEIEREACPGAPHRAILKNITRPPPHRRILQIEKPHRGSVLHPEKPWRNTAMHSQLQIRLHALFLRPRTGFWP